MRRALIADIHGNLIALEAVLKDCAQFRVDEIVCLGDMLGFGPDPVECVDLVMEKCAWSLCGNHDVTLFMDTTSFSSHLVKVQQRERQLFTPHWYSGSHQKARWKWLKSLVPNRSESGVLYVHGSPRDPINDFLLGEDFGFISELGPIPKITDNFNLFDGLCFCAHTHRPGVATEEFKWMQPHNFPHLTYALEKNTKTLINVGSVGQPRDKIPDSCYVIWDEEKQTITFRRVAYDLVAVKERFRRVPELIERLYLRLEKGV